MLGGIYLILNLTASHDLYSASHKIQKINLPKTTVLDKLHSFGDTKYKVNNAQMGYLYYVKHLPQALCTQTLALDSINTYWTWFM